MDRRLELDMAVGLLTRPSKHRIVTESGATQWVTADPLLLQLALAVKSTMAAAAFKSSAGNPLPMNADAHDLMEAIDAEVWEHWWQTHALHYGHGKETLTSRLRTWTASARADAALLDEAAKLTTGWVKQINNLFEPVRTWEIYGACPRCQARTVEQVDSEGETVKRPALNVFFDRQGLTVDGAVCNACKVTWARGDVEALARFVAAQPAPEHEDAA